MTKFNFPLLVVGAFLVVVQWAEKCCCQQGGLFQQSPYQRQSVFQRQQLGQTPQQPPPQTPTFPNSPLNPLNRLTPVTPLTTPLIPPGTFRNYNPVTPGNYVPILAYQNDLNYDGSFSYGYASADGTTAQAQGYVKNLGYGESVEAQVVQGSYSYTSPEGTPITVHYIADENGFRAEGAHIPTPPHIPFQPADPSGALNPYQTPFRPLPNAAGVGPSPTSLSFQQRQQQQQRFLPPHARHQHQQHSTSGQYQPDGQFGLRQLGQYAGGNRYGRPPFDGNIPSQSQQQLGSPGDFQQQLPQQPVDPQLQQQQQQQQQQQPQHQQQQQLATQELRSRSNNLVNPYGYNPNRRYKKAVNRRQRRD